MEDQHIYHHNDADGPRINVKAERNTKGYNYEATITGAKSINEVLTLLNEAIAQLETQYGVKSA